MNDAPASPQQANIFRGYIPELNSVRAVGVLVVVAYHLWPIRTVLWPMNMGWIVVSAFFVLSGFLITGILLDSRDKADYYRSFYWRRSLRIFPLYYFVLGLTTLVLFSKHLLYLQMSHSWGSPWWFFVYLGNIPTALKNAWPADIYLPLWSLQVEEQFYLLFPILVRKTKKTTLVPILWGLIFASVLGRVAVYWWNPTIIWAQYVLLPLRMDGLALGALLAVRFRQGPWNISKRSLTVAMVASLAITAIATGRAGATNTDAFVRTFGYLLGAITCAHVVLWLILFRGSRITAVFRTRPVQYLSDYSYAIYLVHMPIAYLLGLKTVSILLGTTIFYRGIPRLIAVYVLSIAFASLTRRYLENPMLALKDRLKPRESHRREAECRIEEQTSECAP